MSNLEAKRAYNKRIYTSLKERGMCVKCQKVKADPGHATCLVCRMDLRGRSHHRTEAEKEAKAAYMRERFAQHKAAGLCVDCDKPVYRDHVRCYEHYIYQRMKNTARRNKQKLGYAEIGLCRICGKEPAPGKKLCPEHSRQYAERITKMNKERASGVRRD